MFDRFTGVKDQAHVLICLNNVHRIDLATLQASKEGTHFLVPWVQRAILYDCRTKPRVRLFAES